MEATKKVKTPAKLLSDRPAGAPLVLAYGMGVDSTAVIVGFVERGIRPDAILFADTGSEKPSTYAFLPIINAYLREHDFPEVTVVRNVVKNFKNWPEYHTLEENCLTNGTLPSEAFGFGSCSMKWKQAPQHAWAKAWEPARRAWAEGLSVWKAIGFDCSPADSKRTYKADELEGSKTKAKLSYEYVYPLREWGWSRQDCAAAIEAAGLPVPPKSACFFCPNMSPDEVRELEPAQLKKIVVMEARAKPRLTTIKGLWRTGCKGKRDPSKKKPATMTEFIREAKLLSAVEIERLEECAPKEIILRNEAKASGFEVPTWPEFFRALGVE